MRSMTARQGQILVRGVPPDMDSSTIRQAFSHYGKITLVGQTVHGYVVTFENVAVALTAANHEGPKLDDQSLEVWLLRPDVHGCEVIVTSGHVAVNVGRKVLTKITEDKKCHDNFDLKLSLSCTGKFWWNHPGQIGVTCSSPQDLIGWELSVLSELKDLLRPFRQWLEEQPDQISIWERVVGQDSPGSTWDDDFTEVTIPFSVFDEFKFHFFTEEQYGHHLSKTFQQLVFCSDAADKTLTMKGSGSTVNKALKRLSSDHKQLSGKHITIPDTLRQIWKKPWAQKWLQHVLDSENIICSWKETRSFVRSVFDYRGTFLITAFDSDHPKFDRIFKSCFVEAKLRVSRRQIRLLETDTFKSAVKMGMKENEPSPVVFVSPSTGNVTIIDRPARMETTRRIVINFLYDQLIRRHPILCDEPIEETIQDLKPYHVRFLSLPRVMQLLSRDLQQTVFLDSDAAVVFIRAPIDQVDKCVIHVLKYIATISQKIIMPPPALAEIYRQQAVVHYVQGKLNSERLLCHWEVEKGRIIVSAQDADQDNLKRTFLTVFTETQLRIHVQENRPVVRSRDWQTFATNLQKGEEGLPAPVLRWTTSGDVVVVVDRPENIHKTRDAVYRFIVSRGSQMPMLADTTVQLKSSSVMSADDREEALAKEEDHRQVNVSGREGRGENGDHSRSTFPKCIEHGILRLDSADATRPESAHADCDQTYPKVVVSSEDETPLRAHCDMDEELSAWQQQQLSLLTFAQLVELSTHLGVTQSDIDNILSRSEDVETRKRNLTARCVQIGNIRRLCSALLVLVINGAYSATGFCSADEFETTRLRSSTYVISQGMTHPPPAPSFNGERMSLAGNASRCIFMEHESETEMDEGSARDCDCGYCCVYSADDESDCPLGPDSVSFRPMNSHDPVNLIKYTQAESVAFMEDADSSGQNTLNVALSSSTQSLDSYIAEHFQPRAAGLQGAQCCFGSVPEPQSTGAALSARRRTRSTKSLQDNRVTERENGFPARRPFQVNRDGARDYSQHGFDKNGETTNQRRTGLMPVDTTEARPRRRLNLSDRQTEIHANLETSRTVSRHQRDAGEFHHANGGQLGGQGMRQTQNTRQNQTVATETTMQVQLQPNAAIQARLSQLEHRLSQLDGSRSRHREEHAESRSAPSEDRVAVRQSYTSGNSESRLETQMLEILAQLDSMMQILDDLHQQQADDEHISIQNGSDMDSSESDQASLTLEVQEEPVGRIQHCYTLM